jgi:hypothetical protein
MPPTLPTQDIPAPTLTRDPRDLGSHRAQAPIVRDYLE